MKNELGLILILCFLPLLSNAQTDSTSTKKPVKTPPIDWELLRKTEPWKKTEDWTKVKKVVPIDNRGIPQDAIVLFSGKNLDAWQKPQFSTPANMEQTEVVSQLMNSNYTGEPTNWKIVEQTMQCVSDGISIASKQSFGSIQLHIEWLAPKAENVSGQNYSNSGVFFMGLYEVQVLNSYNNPTYGNGQAGAIYKQSSPLVNVSKEPGLWQSYDLIFTAPKFGKNHKIISAAYLTVFHNGVLIQNHFKLRGPTVYIGKSRYVYHQEKLPLILQDHGLPVLYRNIWVRELQ